MKFFSSLYLSYAFPHPLKHPSHNLPRMLRESQSPSKSSESTIWWIRVILLSAISLNTSFIIIGLWAKATVSILYKQAFLPARRRCINQQAKQARSMGDIFLWVNGFSRSFMQMACRFHPSRDKV